jgi:hypothetical protein
VAGSADNPAQRASDILDVEVLLEQLFLWSSLITSQFSQAFYGYGCS